MCWRAPRDNPWATAPLQAVADLLPPPEPADPNAPGPFAFADADRVRDILARAGFANVTVERRDSTMHLGDTVDEAVAHALAIGPLARATAELDDVTRARIADRLRGAIACEMAASVWIVKSC